MFNQRILKMVYLQRLKISDWLKRYSHIFIFPAVCGIMYNWRLKTLRHSAKFDIPLSAQILIMVSIILYVIYVRSEFLFQFYRDCLIYQFSKFFCIFLFLIYFLRYAINSFRKFSLNVESSPCSVSASIDTQFVGKINNLIKTGTRANSKRSISDYTFEMAIYQVKKGGLPFYQSIGISFIFPHWSRERRAFSSELV